MTAMLGNAEPMDMGPARPVDYDTKGEMPLYGSTFGGRHNHGRQCCGEYK